VGRKADHGPGSHQGCVQRGRPTVNIGGIPISRPRAARIGARRAPPRTQANFGPGPCWPANFLFLFFFFLFSVFLLFSLFPLFLFFFFRFLLFRFLYFCLNSKIVHIFELYSYFLEIVHILIFVQT
jgi:hypothetical protein